MIDQHIWRSGVMRDSISHYILVIATPIPHEPSFDYWEVACFVLSFGKAEEEQCVEI